MRPQRSGSNSDGFAALDALVAITILASSIALTLAALSTAQHVAAAALETERARGVLEFLANRPGDAGLSTGRSEGFDWTLSVRLMQPDPAAPAIAMCRREARLVSLQTHQVYKLATLAFCPAPAKGP